MLDHVEMISKR